MLLRDLDAVYLLPPNPFFYVKATLVNFPEFADILSRCLLICPPRYSFIAQAGSYPPHKYDINDHLWGETFASINLLDSLKVTVKPVLLRSGRFDYVVSPISLWDDIDHNCRNIVFERSGHKPMLEEQGVFDKVFIDWL